MNKLCRFIMMASLPCLILFQGCSGCPDGKSSGNCSPQQYVRQWNNLDESVRGSLSSNIPDLINKYCDCSQSDSMTADEASSLSYFFFNISSEDAQITCIEKELNIDQSRYPRYITLSLIESRRGNFDKAERAADEYVKKCKKEDFDCWFGEVSLYSNLIFQLQNKMSKQGDPPVWLLAIGLAQTIERYGGSSQTAQSIIDEDGGTWLGRKVVFNQEEYYQYKKNSAYNKDLFNKLKDLLNTRLK